MSALLRALPNLLVNVPKAAIVAIVCSIGFGISLLINYPGFMSFDSFDQLIEARNGVYSDWHPPFMAFIWHFVDEIVRGPLGMLILITALMWLGTFLIILCWFNSGRFTPLSLFPALLVFYPPIFGISGAIWKDNL